MGVRVIYQRKTRLLIDLMQPELLPQQTRQEQDALAHKLLHMP